MMRKISLALLLCVLLAALYGCTPSQSFPVATQAPPGYGLNTPAVVPTDEPLEYNPEDEEDVGEFIMEEPQEIASVETYAYAGATPLPLDPIDMPTPTPRPKLTFEYQTYEATKLGLKFDGPVGWIVDDSANDTFTLTEPEKRDNYTAFMTFYKVPVNKQYTASDMERAVNDMLENIKSTNFSNDFKPSYTASRTLIGHDGVYANYEGTLVDGTRVRGRVHVTCIDKVLYSLHMSHAAAYNTEYLQNHAKLRSTIALTR